MMITIFGLVGFCVMTFSTIWMAKKYMTNLSEMEDLEAECKRVNEILPNEKAKLASKADREVEERVNEIHQNVNEVQINIMAQALCGQSARDLQSSMKTLIEATYSRMSQEFIGSLSDETDGLLRDLNENLCERIWDSVQQMKTRYDDSPYVLPSGARIAYTKGHRTIVVVEQKPQVRTMGFTPGLVSKSEANVAKSTTDRAYRFTLSFPYVYFFMAFDHTLFKYHEVYFKNKPLTSAREHVYNPPIPNVQYVKENYQPMCMGEGFKATVRAESTISRQCEEVVSEFWQRPFNEHLGSGVTSNTDKRLKSYKKWQEATEEDALFILDVKWGKGKTVKSVLDNMFKMREHSHITDDIDKRIRTMLEKGVEGVNKTLKDAIDSAKKNNTLRAGSLDSVVKEQLEEVVVSHTKKVFEHCTKT